MPIYHYGLEQNSPEWYALRAGKWCASNAATIMGGLATDGLADLVKTIAWERVHGLTGEDRYQSKAMARGHEVEPEARDWLAFAADVDLQQCGFVEHGEVPNVGWSPDALYAGATRGAEIKCLLHKAFMDVLAKHEVPSVYRWQVRFASWVGDLDGIDFVSYHPKRGGVLVPVERNRQLDAQFEERIALLEQRVKTWMDILSGSNE